MVNLDNIREALKMFDSKNYDFNEVSDDLKVVFQILNDSKTISTNKNGKIKRLNNNKLHVGKLQVKKNFGFVYAETTDFYVHDTSNYFSGDIVVAIENPDFKGSSTEVKIIGLISREPSKIVCRVTRSKSLVVMDEKYVNYKASFEDEDSSDLINERQIIQVEVVNVINKILVVNLVKIIADGNDPDLQMKMVLANYEIETEFRDETLKEVENIMEPNGEQFTNRIDFRNENVMTIDGADSKDLDDAIHMIKEGDKYRLCVSIADVSHYVQQATSLDLDAYSRATSVYFVDRVVPMLPKKLSNGICSLHPNVDRLTLSCEMLIDSEGNVVDYKIFESVINSKFRLTYDEVNDMIHSNKTTEFNKPIYSIIKEMDKLRAILNKKRLKNGSFNLEDKDAKFSVDEVGNITDIKPVNRQNGEKLIEEFMILANQVVATHIYHMELPFLYRVHDQPNIKKLKDVLQMFSLFNVSIKGDVHEFRPQMFKQALDQVEDPISKRILSDIIVRSLSKARYQPNNIGHFGLALENYTHFTSPIRRYPDLIVHRKLRKYLFENNVNYKDRDIEEVKQMGVHTSDKEVKAIKAEQQIEDMRKAKYMEQFIGQTYNGVVASIVDYGFFVELENTVRGLIKFRNIKEFTKSVNHKINFSNKSVLTLGDTISVKLDSINESSGIVEFSLVDYTMVVKEKKSFKNSGSKPKEKLFNSKKKRRQKYTSKRK